MTSPSGDNSDGGLSSLGHQIDLVAQVNERGIDRGGREHQNVGANPRGDNVPQELLVALYVAAAEVA